VTANVAPVEPRQRVPYAEASRALLRDSILDGMRDLLLSRDWSAITLADVARAAGLTHVAGSTGATSEAAVQKLHGLPETALIDMGDFVGGMLKYLRRHPVPRITIAGGVAKMTKLAQGLADLHSKRGEVDLARLAKLAAATGAGEEIQRGILAANTTAQAFTIARAAGIALGDQVARAAQETAANIVAGTAIAIEVVLFDREQNLVGRAPFKV